MRHKRQCFGRILALCCVVGRLSLFVLGVVVFAVFLPVVVFVVVVDTAAPALFAISLGFEERCNHVGRSIRIGKVWESLGRTLVQTFVFCAMGPRIRVDRCLFFDSGCTHSLPELAHLV